MLWTSPSFLEVAEYHFYAALARAAHHDDAPADERPAAPAGARRAPAAARGLGRERSRELRQPRGAGRRRDRAHRRRGRRGGAALRAGDPLARDRAISCITRRSPTRRRRASTARAASTLFADTYLREARDRLPPLGRRRQGAAARAAAAAPRRAQAGRAGDDGGAAARAARPRSPSSRRRRPSRARSSATSWCDTLLDVVLEESGARRAALVLETDGKLKIAAESTSEARGTYAGATARAEPPDLDPRVRTAHAGAGPAR